MRVPLFCVILLFCDAVLRGQSPLAVVDFSANGIADNEVIALTVRLRNEIVRLGKNQVIERDMITEILQEQGFQQTGCTTNECLVEVGQLIGVDKIVAGSISRLGNIYTVSARIIDVATGEVIKVTDYDLAGSLGQLLSVGLRQVAINLISKPSGKNNQAIIKPKITPLGKINPMSETALFTSVWDVNIGPSLAKTGGIIFVTKRLENGWIYKDWVRIQPGIDLGYYTFAYGRRFIYRENGYFVAIQLSDYLRINNVVLCFSPAVNWTFAEAYFSWDYGEGNYNGRKGTVFLTGKIGVDLFSLSIPLYINITIMYHPNFDFWSPYLTMTYNL